MPKIKITETVNPSNPALPAVSNTVYIPGKASSDAVLPKLFKNAADLDAAEGYDKATLSYRLARYLINLGIYVLYEGVTITNSVPNIDWTRLQDKGLYDIRFLTTGEFACPTTDMTDCAAKRGDCVALLDHVKTLTDVDDIRAHFGSLVSATSAPYSAAFTPWFKTDSKALVGADSQTGVEEIPASFGYLFAFANSLTYYPEWFAVAGSYRGRITELTNVLREYTSAECEVLQGRSATQEVELDDEDDNKGIAINPIAYVRPFGYIIWGNRTLVNNDGATIATSFLNVRNLVCTVKKVLYNAARKFTFEQNSEVLWINFTSQIRPVLDRMQSGEGLLGYRIERLETTARARLKAKIVLIAIEAVEDFELEVELADSLEVVE